MSHWPVTIFRASLSDWSSDINLGIAIKEGDKLSVASSMNMQTIKPGEAPPEPVLRLHKIDAQALMDELWRVGLRPSEGTGSAGALAATQRHLEDMQGIAIGLLRQQGVEL